MKSRKGVEDKWHFPSTTIKGAKAYDWADVASKIDRTPALRKIVEASKRRYAVRVKNGTSKRKKRRKPAKPVEKKPAAPASLHEQLSALREDVYNIKKRLRRKLAEFEEELHHGK